MVRGEEGCRETVPAQYCDKIAGDPFMHMPHSGLSEASVAGGWRVSVAGGWRVSGQDGRGETGAATGGADARTAARTSHGPVGVPLITRGQIRDSASAALRCA